MKLAEMVDRSYDLAQQIKALSSELDDLKGKLKDHARKYERDYIEGTKADARFAAQPKYTCDSKQLYDAMREAEQEEAFFDVVKVNLKALKDTMGSAFAESHVKNDPDRWGRVNFVPKK